MFDLKADEARLLLDIALMAVGRNRFRSAETVISALEAFRPSSEQLDVARMISFISKGDFDAAVDYADTRAIPAHPGSAMVKVFKGMALLRMGRTAEAIPPLNEAAGQTVDPSAAQLAKDMMK